MPEFGGEGGGDLICSYATEYLLKQISTIRKEIPGVLAATDIEHIHRMRVATRRLRSALPLFPLCFSRKRIKRWRRGLRRTARALGEARDIDIQIAFLEKYVSDLKSGRPTGNQAMLPAVVPIKSYPVLFRQEWYNLSISFRKLMRSLESVFSKARGYLGRKVREADSIAGRYPVQQVDLVPGTECILFRKSQERADLQKEVEKAIWRLEKGGLLGEVEKYLRRYELKDKGFPKAGREIFATAFTSVTTRIDDLLAFGESLADPEKIREHHAMRIAVKRLRYTLEVWRDLFKGEIGNEIDTLKRLQDLLGDLHDCDVWNVYLPEFLKEEERRCRAFFGNDNHFRSLVPGIEALARDRRERRGQLHEITLTLWRELALREFWDVLREKLLLPLAIQQEGPIRIGLVSNISGDAAALRMVLAESYSRGVWLFLNAGDTLGSPGTSRKTVELLRKEGIVSVAGDKDREILDGMSHVRGGRDAKTVQFRQRQSKVTRRFIRALPSSLRLTLAGKSISLTHGSSDIPAGCFDERTPEERLCQIAQECGTSVIVSGHLRRPFIRWACHVLFLQPGTVGKGEAFPPTYAILEIGPEGSMTVTHHELIIEPAGPGAGGSPHPPEIPSDVPRDAGGTRQTAGD
jgi:CHAD domain-containing protein/predicted phosphodiesterase